MKKSLMLLFFVLSVSCMIAQSVESNLRTKFSSVQYHKECGGWYLLSEENNGQTLYGFADSKGNIISSGALKYKINCGFIELYQLDMQKKALHDQWINDMTQYNKDYTTYKSVEAKYESELQSYRTKVAVAETEAKRRWNIARNQVKEKAEREAAALQQQSGGSVLGSILSGVAGGISVAAAVASVEYEPFLNQVLGERDLLVKPSKPYNPMPKKPIEPEDGYYWGRFSLRQPCKYDYIDFDKIVESGNFADVKCNNKWGLVDSYMNEIIPCTNKERVLQGKIFDNFLIKNENKYGVINKKGEYIVDVEYNSIKAEGEVYMVQSNSGYGLLNKKGKQIMPCIYQEMLPKYSYLLCNKGGMWGVYTSNYQELYPCQYQSVSLWKVNDKLVLLTKEKGLWGALDFRSGAELLPNKYSNIKSVKLENEDYYIAIENDKQGLYNSQGLLIIPCQYSSIEGKKVKGEFMIETKSSDGSFALFYKNGIPILPSGKYESYEWVWLKSEQSEPFMRGESSKIDKYASSYYLVKSKETSLYGVCNEYGTELIPCMYSSLKRSGNCFIASKEINGVKTMGCISYLGKELFPFIEATSIIVNDDYCTINRNLESGAISYDGQVIVPIKKNKKHSKIAERVKKMKIKNPRIEALAIEKANILNEDYNKVRDFTTDQWITHKRFSYYAQNYVERVINDWQKKGEFEKLEDWHKRVNDKTISQKAFVLTKQAQDMFIKESDIVKNGDTPYIVGNYDPDNETYRIKTKYSLKEILVKVNPNDAQEFKSNFESITKSPKFFIENEHVSLAEYVFTMPNGSKYAYSDSLSLTHSVAQVSYNFDAIDIDTSNLNKNSKKGKQIISTGNLVYGKSDVDVNIPILNREAPNTFVVIIANENYHNEKNVEFAFNDGQVLKDYCTKMLGIPSENIHFRPDATLNNMKFEVNWLKEIAKVNENARFVFYYAGHGIPDNESRESYLLPIDGYVEDISSAYKLSDLYSSLGELPAENILVLLDACFTGAGRDDEMLANVRGARIEPTPIGRLKGNMVVFTATSSNQTANPFTKQSHGLFTYYLLKGLQEIGNDKIELGNLFNFIKTKVASKALTLTEKISKKQTPTVITSPTLKNSWQNIIL